MYPRVEEFAINQQLYGTPQLQAVLHTGQLFGLGPQLLPNPTERSRCLDFTQTWCIRQRVKRLKLLGQCLIRGRRVQQSFKRLGIKSRHASHSLNTHSVAG